ncbi:TPA: CpsD/CapB family tyrosine-protein kinase [Streptococcus suis]|uniref:CpsD/CapB family tyrosine-protein kinase n=1 Tax=Streptococcus suis TaxID=1307 RepID=UPI0028C3C159|nr:CpsD/CapB family tyrosine-protein kinase [Streptococcus suis]WNO77540.1 CpsD/CapB family tyrosine-protein kinase [Streptococcus suis]HEL1757752.1 CpsD/CapB family tyrosine-protein kinase [Streptococcus suis]HEL1759697.1 CpsD/CapB family tyrosine-protein kinase [Streptococcus suis]HEM2651410.1 CpsD/CapB family tyrosine-protein kinase [Streptococcus suis]HEO8607671.1 CpsD/CapB family tyrosine-protein kinase [Streptococcus suis]
MFLGRRKKQKELNKQQLQGVPLYSATLPTSLNAEQIRVLRTNLEYAQLNGKVKSIGITSSIPGEGKSTVSANLAHSLASAGKKVLIVDADLRKPTVHRTFKVSNIKGLTDLVIGKEGRFTQNLYYLTDLDLYVLPSGPIPPNPSELLQSENMSKLMTDLANYFDFVIYDLPPVNSVTDAQIISRKVDGMILVVRQGYVLKTELEKSLRNLNNVEAKLIGYVMNDVAKDQKDSYYYYYRDSKDESSDLK